MAIKMKVNQSKNSMCIECSTKWDETEEMYDIKISNVVLTLCKKCTDDLFHKTLKASCRYNERLKTKEDILRQRKANRKRGIPDV